MEENYAMGDIQRDEAREIALRFLDSAPQRSGIEVVLLDEATMERNFGWVFFYDSKRHQETGSTSDAIAGNAPLVVTRADGRLHETGTALPIERYLRRFEKYPSSE